MNSSDGDAFGHYLTTEELRELLRSRGLNVTESDNTLLYLETIGHCRLSDYYPAFTDDGRLFDTSAIVTIEDVFRLYSFDRRLRLLLLGPFEKIEVTLRSLIIKEIGDFVGAASESRAVRINLFDRSLYDLSTDLGRTAYEAAREGCWRGAFTKWLQSVGKVKYSRDERREAFDGVYRSMPAWQVLQYASFGPLANLFDALDSRITTPIAKRFQIPRHILVRLFYAMKDLRNACAHHEPIWNWDGAKRSFIMKFPRRYRADAKITDENVRKIYAYCAAIHIFLGFLSNGQTTWYRRLKKLINEFNTIYSTAIGFPRDWQTMPFWCCADVRELHAVQRVSQLHDRIALHVPYEKNWPS